MRRCGARCTSHLFLSPLAVSILLAAPLGSASRAGDVVINEVLYDPEGADTGLEFVELMNCGRHGVNLGSWVLESGNGAHPDDWTVEWIGDDLDYLPPGAIFLIGESDVLPPPDYVAALDLQNGPDAVRLSHGEATVDVVGWGEPLFPGYYEGNPAPDVASGHALARSPDCFDHDDNSLDLVPSPVPTPGARNTLAHDLALLVMHAGTTVLDADSPVLIACTVRNVGSMPVGEGAANAVLMIDSVDGPVDERPVALSLDPRDSTELFLAWSEPTRGYHRATVGLFFAADADTCNNKVTTSFTVGDVGGGVVLNEIMHSPGEGGTEWVELYSVSQDTMAVLGWSLGDGIDSHPLESGGESPFLLAPGAFLVVARDAELLAGLSSAEVIETAGWEALSADDVAVLADEFGTPIDLVRYERTWSGERGVSLERVRPDMPAADPNNWGGSVAPEGGTPGRANSIYLTISPAAGTLTVQPNPFTPDGDGRGDRALVSFDLPTPRATVRLTVFDVEGRVRAVLLDQVVVSSRGELVWDGASSDGSVLPSGLYVLYLEAMDARRGVFVTAKSAVGIVR